MEYFIILLQLIVSIALLSVWLLQPAKPSKWRGGDAKTLKDEFKVYGLPESLFYIVGFLKVSFSVLMLVSIYYMNLKEIAAYGLASLLIGSIVMHFKISDPLKKSFPAVFFLSLCLAIALLG